MVQQQSDNNTKAVERMENPFKEIVTLRLDVYESQFFGPI